MAKIQCYNCKKITPVVAPKYRCRFCNYPLNKYVQALDSQNSEEIIIDNPVIPEPTPPIVVEVQPPIPIVNPEKVEDVLQENKNALDDIQTLLSKLRPDEKVEKAPTGAVIVKENLNPEKAGKIVAGWLVVHTENKIPVTYELFEGDNIIGRPDGPHQVDIRVEDDEYVSRVHAFIRIAKDYVHRFRYELRDDGSLRKGHVSTNGTYINGNPERLPREKPVFLRDGDTIQVGTTKMVFKSVNETDDQFSAFNSVARTNFTETVSIRKF